MTKILDYVLQPDPYTCQSAEICRVLGTKDVYKVRSDLEVMGVPGDPDVMARYLEPRVKEYKLLMDGTLDDSIEYLQKGYSIITHGWFTSSGHVIGLSGYDKKTKTFIVEDPWAEFNFNGWTYNLDRDGNNVEYSALGIYAACVKGESASDSEQIYLMGQTDFKLPKMWLHIVKN